ncbi:pyocin activator PrtN family protein [Paraglaciecola mesophila]|nr:pyocin activator PrtN family protein [Paraglaciecola mesophila]
MKTLLLLGNQFGANDISIDNEALKYWLGETNKAQFQSRLRKDCSYIQLRSAMADKVSIFGLAELIDKKRSFQQDRAEPPMENITLSLLANFGSVIIPFKDIVDKYFNISFDTAVSQAKAGYISLDIFRLTNRQKAPYLVHVDDLSQLLQSKRQEASDNLYELTSTL